MKNNELRTSLGNINKIPRGLSIISKLGYKRVINFGCGLGYIYHTDYFKDSLELINYDPNIPNVSSKPTKDIKADAVVCNNVLNVIEDDNILFQVLYDLESYNIPIYITIYEGNRSGVSKVTKANTFQRNIKSKEYTILSQLGYKYESKTKVWVKGV